MTLSQKVVVAFIVADFFLLFFLGSQLSISYNELEYLASDTFYVRLISSLVDFLDHAAGSERILPLLLHSGSVVLLFLISRDYFFKQIDQIYNVLLFMLLPGVISSALLINSAGLILFFLLLFMYVFRINERYALFLLPFLLLVDKGFFILYSALIFWALERKRKEWLLISTAMLIATYALYGLESFGKPKGHFLDIFAEYAAIFSPLLFLYYFYAIYRVFVKEERELLWYVAGIALIISFILSIRQNIAIELFAPYVVVATPLVVRTFVNGYRIRIKEYRGFYRGLFTVIAVTLLMSSLVMYANKLFFVFFSNQEKSFIYKHYIAKELAGELHKMGINAIHVTSTHLQKRLEFYGIGESSTLVLQKVCTRDDREVSIRYINREVSHFCVSKLNN